MGLEFGEARGGSSHGALGTFAAARIQAVPPMQWSEK
jgi:hypothetical protein